MSKQGSCLEKEIVQGTTPAARRRGRPCTAWMDNIKMWTGLPVEESVRMTEDRDRESTSMAWPTLGSRTAEEQNRTGLVVAAAYQPLLSAVLFISRQSSESLSVTKLDENSHQMDFTTSMQTRTLARTDHVSDPISDPKALCFLCNSRACCFNAVID